MAAGAAFVGQQHIIAEGLTVAAKGVVVKQDDCLSFWDGKVEGIVEEPRNLPPHGFVKGDKRIEIGDWGVDSIIDEPVLFMLFKGGHGGKIHHILFKGQMEHGDGDRPVPNGIISEGNNRAAVKTGDAHPDMARQFITEDGIRGEGRHGRGLPGNGFNQRKYIRFCLFPIGQFKILMPYCIRYDDLSSESLFSQYYTSTYSIF